MEENFATRLKLFLDSKGIPSSQFADLCEIPRPSFSQLLSGRNQKVSDTLIKKIHSAFPDLSVMWLMFGEGNMLSKTEEYEDDDLVADHSECSENDADIPDSRISDRVASEFSNVRGLNSGENAPNNTILQQLEENKKIMELQLQIEKLQKNPRKVTQITVYYDDSTFETFVPLK